MWDQSPETTRFVRLSLRSLDEPDRLPNQVRRPCGRVVSSTRVLESDSEPTPERVGFRAGVVGRNCDSQGLQLALVAIGSARLFIGGAGHIREATTDLTAW